ncbi:MAG: hypothetical protein KAX19_13485 [Candidatus Brocadiae bacterium]|nr:hypothetical protein [Candidatus Brocadiia bacterium]
MSDVIERLLEVEQQARRIIAEAEREAARTVDRARQEARRIAAEGREEARRQAEQLVAHNARALQEQKEKLIEQERRRLPSAQSIGGEELAKAVEFAVRVIACNEEPDR